MRHSAGFRLRGWSECDAAVATGEGRRLRRRRPAEPRWRPSAIAGAHGIEGMIARATTATATVVSPTANITSPVTGAQLSLRSRSDASYAASSSTGATNSASASSGGRVKDGAAGRKASSAPPSARNTGYGAPTRRATPARITAATNKLRSCSNSPISLRVQHRLTPTSTLLNDRSFAAGVRGIVPPAR